MEFLKQKNVLGRDPNGRPTFYYEDESEPVRAAGAICTYINAAGEERYLMIFEKGRRGWTMGDIGGKTEPSDKCILDTIRREVGEETNFALFGTDKKRCFNDYFYMLLRNSKTETFYHKNGKYVILKITFTYHDLPKCMKNFMSLSNERFGRREDTDGIEHYFRWMKKVEKNKKLHVRLRDNHGFIFKDLVDAGDIPR